MKKLLFIVFIIWVLISVTWLSFKKSSFGDLLFKLKINYSRTNQLKNDLATSITEKIVQKPDVSMKTPSETSGLKYKEMNKSRNSRYSINSSQKNLINTNSLVSDEENVTNISTHLITEQPQRKLKKILYWTKFWGHPVREVSQKTLVDWKCEVTACEVTTNRSLLTSSDAVLFHVIDMNREDLPPIRNPLQPWILYILEAPANYNQPTLWRYFFNWTMSYRLDSDVFAPYGVFKPRKLRKPKLNINYAQNKSNKAVWIVSHCSTDSRREIYVRKLSKYYPVDIYGACGTLHCSKSREKQCLEEISQRYKYYLSFENSLCKDYATEKVYGPLTKNIVPIVYGGANYSLLVPPNSLINVFDFSSPKDLAQYLRILDKYDFLYNSYFEWKNEFIVENSFQNNYCHLCKKLHEQHTGSSKVYDDLSEWWVKEGNCMKENQILDILN